ncbi:hypothetical protein [Streptomyces sp. SAS_270]|uniref:hypothetical protein n=1 Tax=Streptomyces sp. SAS_270 TaxID=3412748 RepID=UPI00403CE482
MTPWLRTLRVTGLLLVLATGAVPTAYAPYTAHAAAPAPAPTASRAGSLPGEGRERPGREDPVARDEDGVDEDGVDEDDDGVADQEDQETGQEASPEATVTPVPSQNAAIPVRRSVVPPVPAEEPVLRIVSLGSGLILVGLGLGLAFVALRVRRG